MHQNTRKLYLFLVFLLFGVLVGLLIQQREMPAVKPAIEIEKPAVIETPETGQPVAEEQAEVQEEKPAAPAKKAAEEAIVEVKRTEIEPKELAISQGTKVRWSVNDARHHQISCYNSQQRIFISERMFMGDSASYTFNEEGSYLCLDSVFGLRSTITVTKAAKITGGAITEMLYKNPAGAVITIILTIIFLVSFYIYAHLD